MTSMGQIYYEGTVLLDPQRVTLRSRLLVGTVCVCVWNSDMRTMEDY
jgi:hypothetical protein